MDGYLADGFGIIPVVVDLDMPNDQVAVGDSRKIGQRMESKRTPSLLRKQTPARENKETLQGKFGLAVENVGQSHGLLTGLTTLV